MLSICRIN